MSLLSYVRTFVHRKIVLKGTNFLYRRVYGMDLGEDVRISSGARVDNSARTNSGFLKKSVRILDEKSRRRRHFRRWGINACQ